MHARAAFARTISDERAINTAKFDRAQNNGWGRHGENPGVRENGGRK